MAGDGDHPGANKREREAVGRPEAPSKGGGDAVKRKKPYDAPGARGGGSKEKPQPVTAMEKRVAAEKCP